MILLQETELEAEVPDLDKGGYRRAKLLYRADPLFGHGTRLIEGAKLQPAAEPLGEVVERSGFCPFCADTIDSATAPFPEEISRTGRIIVGNSWVVPNIIAYSAVSAVCVYDVSRHFLSLVDLTRDVIYDALSALTRHAKAAQAVRPELAYSSINANYLPPSGSSLIHPHVQSSLDPVPLGAQRRMIEYSRSHLEAYSRGYFEELVSLEEVSGARFVGWTGPLAWLVPFAPSGFYEVWAVASDHGLISELADDTLYQLATGMSLVMGAYAASGLQSFNFSLMSASPEWRDDGSRLLFRMLARAPLSPYYRSDVTYFERLGQEAMIDYSPEEWAATLRSHFGAGLT